MARVTQRQLELMLQKLEPRLQRAFMAFVRKCRAKASPTLVAELIRLGRVDDLLGAIGMTEPALAELTEAFRSVYVEAGKQGILELPVVQVAGLNVRQAVAFSFDMRNRRAEDWLRQESSKLVTAILESQREAIRIAVSHGMTVGDNPRQTALNIIGRIGTNGQRSGGIIGLTEQQSQFVANMRAQLLSGDRDLMQAYFERKRRDQRFDGAVRRAIESGKPLTAKQVDTLAGRYADRLLQLRGETIARTESLSAFNAGRKEAFAQAIDSGSLRKEHVRKGWSATMDSRTRDAHSRMNGVTVGFDEPFVLPSGSRLMHPGDTSLGAHGEDVIACRCMAIFKINQIAKTLGGS